MIPAGPPSAPRKARFRVPLDKLWTFAQVVKRHAPLTENELNTPDQIETATNNLIKVLDLALKSTGRPAHNYGQDSTWWNDECETALRTVQQAKEEGADDDTFEEARKVYQKTIRRYKKQYWEKQISEAKSDRAIYKITGWHKLTDSFRAPPLTHEGTTVTDT